MIKTTELPEDFITGIGEEAQRYPFGHVLGPKVEKRVLEGIDEIQQLYIAPWTSIKMHGHNKQWEVWVSISHKVAYVCLIGEEHELINNSNYCMVLMAIKGHMNYSYYDFEEFFSKLGFSVMHGSLVAMTNFS